MLSGHLSKRALQVVSLEATVELDARAASRLADVVAVGFGGQTNGEER